MEKFFIQCKICANVTKNFGETKKTPRRKALQKRKLELFIQNQRENNPGCHGYITRKTPHKFSGYTLGYTQQNPAPKAEIGKMAVESLEFSTLSTGLSTGEGIFSKVGGMHFWFT